MGVTLIDISWLIARVLMARTKSVLFSYFFYCLWLSKKGIGKIGKAGNHTNYDSRLRQVGVWQSATLLPISCKSVQPVPALLGEPVSPLRHCFRWWHEQSTLSQDAISHSQLGKVGCQNWHNCTSAYSAAGGEREQQWYALKLCPSR